ncbi:putative major facilitator superfamily transporter protein [Botrytis fragariae]|uniref:Putative major facilitator superfamily transporter protein n=1 Tax=Botrytis fragariae TaxID=1964551 RepID=A0A8H6EP58_9HELO|nr:putative major facilitator superfamily transporter protein [Botrytis fragariae]KAF5879105.1 putative major facilitator superfamily transporter protein [Botrytis fragariae]
MLSRPLPQGQRLDLISFLAQDPLPASISQIASEIQFLRECPQVTTDKRKAKMVRPAIESDNSGESAAISSFGVPLSTTSNRNGRVNRWRTRVNDADGQYPGSGKLTLTMLSLYLITLTVALDRTILSTAIPAITNEFNTLEDIGWYASAYLLASCAAQLVFGKIYKFYNYKWVLMIAVVIFEVGSAVCGSSSNSKVFIVGRAIVNGAILILDETVPLHCRSIFMSLLWCMFAIATVCGPLIGGVFTERATWRWCFYINLPVGGAAAFILLFVVKGKSRKNTDTFVQRLRRMDPIGTLVFTAGIVSVLLALQFGGNQYSLGDTRSILLFILGGILLVTFVTIQFTSGDDATVPIRIIRQRSVASVAWFSFFNSCSFYLVFYYIPIWFQAVQGLDAFDSGLHALPLVLALVFATLFAAIFQRSIGYYVPMVVVSSIIAPVGAGLLTTLQVNSGPKEWMSWPVVFGSGLGLGIQQISLVVQASLPDDDIPVGLALIPFFQTLGDTIFVTVGQFIFSHELVKNLSALNLPSLPTSLILHTGATELRILIPAQYLPEVLSAYHAAIMKVFLVAIITSALTIFTGLTLEWKNVNKFKKNFEVTRRSIYQYRGERDCPFPLYDAGSSEHVQPGFVDTQSKPIMETKLDSDLQQQLETIREEREKSSSAETNSHVIKISNDTKTIVVGVSEKNEDEIEVVG